MPHQGRNTSEWPSFDVRAVSKVASETEERLEVRGTVLLKACKCAGTSSSGRVEKTKNAKGGVSLSFDPKLRCDICATAWVEEGSSGL